MTTKPAKPPAELLAQPVRGFHDTAGKYFYEFNNVYRGGLLDEGLSFWTVTWPTLGGGNERWMTSSMTFARARELAGGAGLKFRHFGSQAHMRESLPALLLPGTPPKQP